MDPFAHENATTGVLHSLIPHHPSAVSRGTEPAEPLTVCEFQRPSAAEDFMQPWQRQQPPQRLADQEHPRVSLKMAHKQRWQSLFSACLHIHWIMLGGFSEAEEDFSFKYSEWCQTASEHCDIKHWCVARGSDRSAAIVALPVMLSRLSLNVWE